MADRNTYMREWNRKNKDRISKQRSERMQKLKTDDHAEYQRRRSLSNSRNEKYYAKYGKQVRRRAKAKNWWYDKKKRVGIRARYYDRHPVRNLLRARKASADRKGLPFTLTEQWYERQFTKGCAVTGIPFDPHRNGSPWVAHIDRKVPSRGYTPRNCQLVCACYNIAKKHWAHEDVMKMARAIIERADA